MKLTHPRGRRQKRGSALILSMIVLTSLGVLSLAFLQGMLQGDKESGARLDEERANMVLDAAFSEALAALSAGYVGSVGTIDAPATFGDGIFWVEATDLGDGHTRLYATAMIGRSRLSQEVVAKVDPQLSDFEIQAVVSRGDITLWPNVTIDSYDPTLGDYASQPKNKNASGEEYIGTEGAIVTNGAVKMKSGSAIMGDLIVGPGESTDVGQGEVEGTVTSNDEPVTFGLPKLPNLASLGDMKASGTSLGPGVYRYDDLVVSDLEIEGPATIICDSLDFQDSAKLKVDDTNGGVNFMVLGNYTTTTQENFKVKSGSPSAVRYFLYDAVDILTQPGDVLWGLFYAPRTTFDLESKTEIYGAVICDDLQAAPKCKLHFDEQFLTETISVIGIPDVTRAYWAEAELPDALRKAGFGDPFRILGIDRNSLRPASEAWDMTYRPLEDQYGDKIYAK